MRFLLSLVALLTVFVGNATPVSAGHKERLMSLEPFDRACVLIRSQALANDWLRSRRHQE